MIITKEIATKDLKSDLPVSTEGKACKYTFEAQKYLLEGKYKSALEKAQQALNYSPNSSLILNIIEQAQIHLNSYKLLPLSLLILTGSSGVRREN